MLWSCGAAHLRQILSTAFPRFWGSTGDKSDCDVVDSGLLPLPTYTPEPGELSLVAFAVERYMGADVTDILNREFLGSWLAARARCA